MICVFSFCASDQEMAHELASHIECLGGVKQHELLILAPEGVDAREIYERLQGTFAAVSVLQYAERTKGWPDGPNQCFVEAAGAMLRHPSKEPWLWLEADCVPTRPSWLNEIAAEYRFCGKPVLGVRNNTHGLDGGITGEHVTGVAVYPHDFLSECTSLKTLVQACAEYRKIGHCPPAFDVYIAPFCIPRCADSQSIVHYWKSHSYKEYPDGTVRCEFTTPYGMTDIVDFSAALIHGAKDLTLMDIIQSRLLTNQI